MSDIHFFEKLTVGKQLSTNEIILCYAAASGCINEMKELEGAVKVGLSQNIVSEQEFYESLLQIYLFAGFPAAIESLAVYNEVSKNKLTPVITEKYDVERFRERGEELCRNIYTTVYDKMRNRLGSISPELDEWMIIEGYGKTLSRQGLPPKKRELITAASLIALGWENQLYSHIRGAIAVGASRVECIELLEVVKSLCTDERIEKSKIVVENALNKQYE